MWQLLLCAAAVSAGDVPPQPKNAAVATAARDFRVTVYGVFRTERPRYNACRAAADSLLASWVAADEPETNQLEVVNWFLSARRDVLAGKEFAAPPTVQKVASSRKVKISPAAKQSKSPPALQVSEPFITCPAEYSASGEEPTAEANVEADVSTNAEESPDESMPEAEVDVAVESTAVETPRSPEVTTEEETEESAVPTKPAAPVAAAPAQPVSGKGFFEGFSRAALRAVIITATSR